MTAEYTYLTDTGTIVADTQDLLTDVQGEWKGSLGQSLDVDASTPQGTLIGVETTTRTSLMRNNADVANTINPNLSHGVFLDAVCAFLGIPRGENSSTLGTQITATGDEGTLIQALSRVRTDAGDIFEVVSDATIPASGTVLISMQSQSFGPIDLPVGNLNIMDGIIGWSTCVVGIASEVTLGTLSLTDPQLKTRRRRQLAIQGRGSSEAIQANLLAVPNVKSVAIVENNTGAPTTINGVTFTMPSAMWVCVSGTADKSLISQALYEAHQGGCPWDFGAAGMGIPVDAPNGTPATDAATGLQYFTKHTTGIMFDVYVKIVVKRGSTSSSPTPAVQNAMLSYANGQEEGEEGLVLGADVSAFEMSGAVVRQMPGIYIKSCMVAAVPAGSTAPLPGAYVYEHAMNPYEQGSLAFGNIDVEVD